MKTPALLALLGAAALLPQAAGTIVLNEININPPTDLDLNFEFIELRSTTNGAEACTGLTLLIIENNGGQVGEVEEALNLDGLTTGSNGLLLLGNGYDGEPKGGPWSGFKAPATTTADPSGSAPYSGLGDDDIDPNGGLTFLLVSGWQAMTNASPTSLGDVDVNNNSVLDWLENPKPAGSQQTQPYTALVDSIGFRDLGNAPVRLPYTTADLNLRPGSPATFAPDNISRRLSRSATPGDQNNAAAWYGGNLAGTSGNAVAYDVQFFGDFKGQSTPGSPNLDAAPTVGNFLINEVSINPPGTNDANYEFVEIVNASGGAASLQGLALLVVRSNDGAGAAALGTITDAWDLGSFVTGANGLLLLGNDYPVGDIPWGRYVDSQTQIADPTDPANQVPPIRWSSMGDEDLASNNGFTLLLVQNFTGTLNQDLDTNNDGVLDVNPWTAIKDSVGFDQTAPGTGKTYAAGKIVTAPAYDVDNLSRKLGNSTANNAAAWYGGDYGGNSAFSIGFQSNPDRPLIGGFRGAATPGRTNLNAAATPAPIRINEVQLNPVPSPDASYEYLELANTELMIGGMNGLTLVVASAEPGAANGEILEAIDLSGLSTGPNGLAILGDSYDNVSPYDIPNKQISPLTTREDPAGLDAGGDLGPNSGVIILVTKGAKPAIGSNVSSIAAADIVDSIGFGSSPNPSVTLVSPGFEPDNLSRLPSNFTANTVGAWYGGDLDPAFGDASLYYGATYFGPYKGGASPGRYNHSATPSATGSLVLNEIHINPPGGDGSVEFIEYLAVPTAAASTNGYTLLMIDGTGGNTGTIMEAWSLDGLATGTNGLLLTGAGYPASSPWTAGDAPAAATVLASPADMDPADIAGFSANGTVSFLLVKFFTGHVGQDLDGGLPPSGAGADDGSFDTTPWTAPPTDAAGIRLWDTTLVPPALSGRVYGGVDLSQFGYTPDSVARRGDNLAANTVAAWYGGDISGSVSTSTAYDAAQKFPAAFAGMVTAGKPNVGTPTIDDNGDEDQDGVINLIELALNMNPAVPDPQKLPQTALLDVGGTLYPSLSLTRFTGGTTSGQTYTANGFNYEVQASLDLSTWTGVTQLASPPTPTGDGLTETAVFRPESAYFTSALASGGKVFMRVKISRP